MRKEKDRDVYERIADGIDDQYVNEMLETLQSSSVKERKPHSWAMPVLAAAVVIVLLAIGTINILYHQKKEDITAQTERSGEETEAQSMDSSGNDAEETAQAARSDAELDAEIEALLERMYPERTEVYFEALAKRNDVFYGREVIVEEYVNEEMQEYEQNNERYRQNIYNYIAECMDGGETKEQVVKRLRQWAEAYPELTDEQEAAFNERYEYYDACYRSCVELYGNSNIDFIEIALYYEMIGRPDEELCVIFQLTADEAEKLIATEWTGIEYGGAVTNEWKTEDFCYGTVSAKALLRLVESGDVPKILYVREDVPFPQMNISSWGSIANGVQYIKTHGSFAIRLYEGKEIFYICGYYDD